MRALSQPGSACSQCRALSQSRPCSTGSTTFPNGDHLCLESQALVAWGGGLQDDSGVAVPPAAVIERRDEVAGLGERDGVATQSAYRAAPAVSHQDAGQFLVCVRLQGENLGCQASALAVDRVRPPGDLFRRLPSILSGSGRSEQQVQNCQKQHGLHRSSRSGPVALVNVLGEGDVLQRQALGLEERDLILRRPPRAGSG